MANPQRPGQGKPVRHLSVVPDVVQPPLWDSDEMSRLARLRQVAINSGQPAEAVELIESAATADEAVDLLQRAGLMPSQEEGLAATLAWFGPVLEPGASPLDAELAASAFLCMLRRAQPGYPGADVEAVLSLAIEHAAATPGAAALALLRSCSVVGPAASRAAAATAAAAMVAAGQDDFPWSAGLGDPAFVHGFGYEDIYGEQRSIVLIFSYGTKRHAFVVLVDHLLGGGVKDCFVTSDVRGLRAEYRKLAAGQEELKFGDLSAVQARAILEVALACPPCPVDPEQVEDVEENLDLLRARVALLPATSAAARAAAAGRKAAARTSQRARTVHRLKVTLRGTRPPVWRRLEVPSDITLERLHDAIQVSFGWADEHLHVFETRAGSYGNGGTGMRSDARKKLSEVARWPDEKISYEYDFGDSWEHAIVVEAVGPAGPGVAYPRCTAGRRAGPPEDCGGVPGYEELLEILADPGHEAHDDRVEWLGLQTAAQFDPARFDAAAVNGVLSRAATVLRKEP